MPWFKIDDGMLDHPKWKRAIRGAGSAALHMWVALGTWSSRHLTDGLVPADMLAEVEGPRGKRTRERALRVLAECRLVIRHINGDMLVHDYLDYNPSRADVMAERERWARSKQKHRVAPNVPPGLPVDSRECPGVPSHSRPVPFPSRPDHPTGDLFGAAEPPPKPKAPRKATALPPDLTPNAATLATAREQGVSLAVEMPQFIDHHTARGTLSKDWQASLRYWLRNAKKGPFRASNGPSKGDPRMLELAELRDQYREEERLNAKK